MTKNNKKSDAQKMRQLLNDMSKINESISLNFASQLHKTTFDNPLSLYFSKHGYNNNLIFEGLITTYSTEKTVEYVKKYFNIDDDKILITDDGCILTRIPNVGNNVEVFSKAMNLCGFFLSTKGHPIIKNNVEWLLLQYEPKFQNDESNTIRSSENVLYHVTPKYNENKILKNGLSPRWKNNLFFFPDRIYLIKGSTSEDEIINITKQLYFSNNSKGNDGNYIILKINLSEIPENVKMFIDNNYKNGIFITDNIKPNCITDIGDINMNNEKVKIVWR